MTGQTFGTQLVAGDTWTWSISSAGYSPDDGYSLKFFLRGTSNLDLTATVADDGSFLLTAAAADTAELAAGTYGWQLAVFKDTDRTELARGTIDVLPDIEAQGVGTDSRSWVEQALAAVRAVIKGTASRVEEEYQINGRMLRLRSIDDLLKLESYLVRKLRRMKIAAGQISRNSGDVRVRFTTDEHYPGGRRGWRS